MNIINNQKMMEMLILRDFNHKIVLKRDVTKIAVRFTLHFISQPPPISKILCVPLVLAAVLYENAAQETVVKLIRNVLYVYISIHNTESVVMVYDN